MIIKRRNRTSLALAAPALRWLIFFSSHLWQVMSNILSRSEQHLSLQQDPEVWNTATLQPEPVQLCSGVEGSGATRASLHNLQGELSDVPLTRPPQLAGKYPAFPKHTTSRNLLQGWFEEEEEVQHKQTQQSIAVGPVSSYRDNQHTVHTAHMYTLINARVAQIKL